MPAKQRDKGFWFALTAAFAVALSYPAAIVMRMGGAGWPWIQNVPAFNAFILLVFPVATALFVHAFDLRALRKAADKFIVLSRLTLGILVALAATLTWQDAFHSTGLIPPHMIRQDTAALARAEALRLCMPSPREVLLTENHKIACAKLGPATYSLDDIRAAYARYATPFHGPAEWLHKGSGTAVASLLLCFLAAEFLAIFLWYCLVLLLTRKNRPTKDYDAPAFVLALLLTFFPTRIYSAWYVNLYSLDPLGLGSAFFTISIIALILIFLFTYLYAGSTFVKWVGAIFTAFGAVFAIIAYFNQQWLWWAFGLVEEQSPAFVVGDVLLIFLALLFVSIAVLE